MYMPKGDEIHKVFTDDSEYLSSSESYPSLFTDHDQYSSSFSQTMSLNSVKDLSDTEEANIQSNLGYIDQTNHEANPEQNEKRGNLMSILCGRQDTAAKEKKLNAVVSNNQQNKKTTNKAEAIPRVLKQPEDTTDEIERKIYSDQMKSLSVSEILSKGQNSQGQNEKKRSNNGTDTVDEEVIEIPSDREEQTAELEEKIFGQNAKRTSIRDAFKSLGMLGNKKNKQPQSFPVTLNISPALLAEVKKQTNPFFTRGNSFVSSSGDNISIREALMQGPIPKLSTNVEDDATSIDIATDSDSQDEESLDSLPATNTSALDNAFIAPSIGGDFHFVGDEKLFDRSLDFMNTSFNPRIVSKAIPNDFLISNEHGDDLLPSVPTNTSSKYKVLRMDFDNEHEFQMYIKNKFENSDFSSIHVLHKLYSMLMDLCFGMKTEIVMWVDQFRPLRVSELFMPQQYLLFIDSWLRDTFQRLSSLSFRPKLSSSFSKKTKKQEPEPIIDFFFDDLILTDSQSSKIDYFTPLLIVEGPSGSCKSSSIYAAANELNAYVYEINAGQSRGKKDILNVLREFCTTQLVHQTKESKLFQKGLVLLEDCDILFEEDKNFWAAVLEILCSSRRPLILTCHDISLIPTSIAKLAEEENAIIKIDDLMPYSHESYRLYLQLCCLNCGYDVEEEVLDQVLNDSRNRSGYDLRKCLMNIQFICQNFFKLSKNLLSMIHIMPAQSKPNTSSISHDLNEIANTLDTISLADVLQNNSFSLLKPKKQKNELLNTYYIDDSLLMKQKSLPYETNIGTYLTTRLPSEGMHSYLKKSFSEIRDIACTYVGSRSKKLPRLTRENISERTLRPKPSDANNSSLYSFMDISGLPDGSFLTYSTQFAYMVDIMPFIRHWSRYQKSLDRIEQETIEKQNISLKRFIGWREFQDKSNRLMETFMY